MQIAKHVSSVSRKLIRRAKLHMDSRLNTARLMIKTLLQEELSEAHLGLPEPARQHLDRFREFLQAFYTTKFGCYPPNPREQTNSVFEPAVLSAMRCDFECLYGFLVDQSFNTAEDSPFLATGGICTLQCVQSFDIRYKFTSLPQPLPLLPDVPETKKSRKSWLAPRNDKIRPAERFLSHAALIRASNTDDGGLLENDLVRAYRKFEEDFIFSPAKADKPERVSQVDARKVRWILVYCIYQTLRSVTEVPPQVRHRDGVPYHLAVGTDMLPPWKEDRAKYPPASSHRGPTAEHTGPRGRSMTTSAVQRPTLTSNTEIKPDVDYFALANNTAPDASAAITHETPVNSTLSTPQGSKSLMRGLSRNNTVRRSLSFFSKSFRASSPSVSAQYRQNTISSISLNGKRPAYHEIVIHGYGNGTNPVYMATEYVASANQTPESQKSVPSRSPSTTANTRSLSNASKSSDGSAISGVSASTAATAETAASSIATIHDYPPSTSKKRKEKAPCSAPVPPQKKKQQDGQGGQEDDDYHQDEEPPLPVLHPEPKTPEVTASLPDFNSIKPQLVNLTQKALPKRPKIPKRTSSTPSTPKSMRERPSSKMWKRYSTPPPIASFPSAPDLGAPLVEPTKPNLTTIPSASSTTYASLSPTPSASGASTPNPAFSLSLGGGQAAALLRSHFRRTISGLEELLPGGARWTGEVDGDDGAQENDSSRSRRNCSSYKRRVVGAGGEKEDEDKKEGCGEEEDEEEEDLLEERMRREDGDDGQTPVTVDVWEQFADLGGLTRLD